MDAFLSLLQALADLIAPVFRFIAWVWPVKVAWLHDGERGVICTWGQARRWRKAEREPGVTVYGPFEDFYRVQAEGCYVDTPEQTLVTGDGRAIVANAALEYTVTNARRAILMTANRENYLTGITMDALRIWAGRRPWEQIVQANPDQVTTDIAGNLNRRLVAHGCRIEQLWLTDLRPHPVQIACDTVTRLATEERQ